MKNCKIFVGLISILLGIFLLGGCSDILNSPANNNAGGLVTISIDSTGRTLLPSALVFSRYELTFTPNAGQTAPVQNPVILEGSNSYTLTLDPGSWTISVIGMVLIENIPGIDDGYYEAAASEPVNFTVGEGASNNVAVTVRGGIQEGVQGLFSWDISFPDDVIAGTLEILDIDEQPIEGIEPVDLMEEENRAGTIALNPGYYFLKVELENGDGNKAYRAEIFHIYSNLTTTAGSGNGYAFTSASFAPITNLSGQVLFSAINGINPQGTVSLYRDNALTQLIDETAFDENGEWSLRISSYYNSVYLKATLEYSGTLTLSVNKGPVSAASTNTADWTINAQGLLLTGTVQLDSIVETEEMPTVSIYENSGYTSLIATVSVNNNGTWSTFLRSGYTSVYLRASVTYTGYTPFTKDKGPVTVTSANANDWTIDARLLRLAGTVQLGTGVETAALTLYQDSGYTNAITPVNVNTTTGAWSVILIPIYTNVYMRATVKYDDFESFTKDKGPVNVTSTNANDWTIDAQLLHLTGTVQLEAGVDTVELTLYQDSAYANAITTVNVNTTTGAWSVTLLPNYTNVYIRASVTYTGYAPFTQDKGPVNVASTNAADWIISCPVPNTNITIGGDPSVKLFLDNGTTPLTNNDSTIIGNAGTGLFTVSIGNTVTYTEIKWYVNGNLVAQDARTSITLPKRTAGTYLVTVEATADGVKNTSTHSFVVE